MNFNIVLVLAAVSLSINSCNLKPSPTANEVKNPAAEGFNLANSDPAAVELADSIMEAMGGWENWQNARFISWNFFGRRDLIWDKKQDRVRIESPSDSITYLLNLNNVTGKIWVKGQELPPGDSLNNMLKRGKSIWINDSYWLVMPFKLKDSGVTLKYLGEDTLMDGKPCNLLELTFDNVGDTPQNKYEVYVDLADNLVKQWAYYSDAKQDSANFVRPWDNYKKYGNILISADRSDDGGPKNVKVTDTIDPKVFADLE
jgi:hypothetical protein